MRLRRSSRRPSKRALNLRILAAALCVSLISGAIGLMLPVESYLTIVRNKIRLHPPSGKIVLVAIDDQSEAAFGSPWPRARTAQLIDLLKDAGAGRIVIGSDLSIEGDKAGDAALKQAIERAAGHVVLTSSLRPDGLGKRRIEVGPLPQFTHYAPVGSTSVRVQWNNQIWEAPYAIRSGRTVQPGLASLLTGVKGEPFEPFPIDYSIDVTAEPTVTAADILRNRWNPAMVAGRDVIIGETGHSAPTDHLPSFGLKPRAAVLIAAVETLKEGRPTSVGGLPWICFAFVAATVFLFLKRRFAARAILLGAMLTMLAAPFPLEQNLIFSKVMPGLLLLLIVGIAHVCLKTMRTLRARGMTNAITGLPTLAALRDAHVDPNVAVVVAKIANFAEVSSALPGECERELVEQITNRLSVGAHGSIIYQADEGLFIWIADAESEEQLGEQLVALHALFRSPVVVATRLIDLTIGFGLDMDVSRPAVQRVSSALVAADRAISEGRRWMTYDPAELEDAEWKMSLLARLDQAVDQGEIWVAFQPKVELETGRIVGAEALARWSHPEKGEIPPNHFIPAAEQSGRIEKLTQYVLDVAVQAAATIHRTRCKDFSIAVNISARLLDGPGLIAMVNAALARHRLPAHLLILEVTETAAMAGQDEAFAALQALSGMGVRLSIDDYGTGFSTLDYLKRIPADEIKIDRSFISMLEKSQSDRIMVHSTIQLAHSLGRKAIAEGVETAIVLNELRLMQCDLVQGYLTGKPMRFQSLLAELPQPGAIAAA